MAKKTPSAQLDREISSELAAGAARPIGRKADAHSVKALMTLAEMGTPPDAWRLTPIKWVEEEREIYGQVKCPICGGHKSVRVVDGVAIPRPSKETSTDEERYEYDRLARIDARSDRSVQGNGMYGNCKACLKRTRGWLVPSGMVRGLVRAKVMVGYPQFPVGTRFDSRFAGAGRCNLCNKEIIKSGRVPVHGQDMNGATHGMFVGEDCAKKFLDVKIKRASDSVMEDGNGR